MKIIFFDIDGTLIGSESHLMSDSTKKAIRTARENGNLCIVNTGRTQKLVGPEITEQVEFDGYLMGCGTMVVYHNQVLMHQTFPLPLSRRIMDGLERNGIDVIFEGCENNYCVSADKMRTKTFQEYLKRLPEHLYTGIEEAAGHFDKFFCYVDETKRMESFRAEFRKELDVVDRENGFYEVMPKGYSKATAIRFLADRLHISMEDTVAVGDSNNDLPMFACAHIGIAMENSSKAVLEAADYVTTDVMEDGIWNALNWLGVL